MNKEQIVSQWNRLRMPEKVKELQSNLQKLKASLLSIREKMKTPPAQQ